MNDRVAWGFDDFEVDVRAWRLSRAGRIVPLEPKALALLALLLERQGEVVTKAEILDAVWKDTSVTENAMVRVIAQIRAALGDDSKEPKYIETVHTRGYRFLRPAERLDAPPVVTEKRPLAFDPRWVVVALGVVALAAAGGYYFKNSSNATPSTGGASVAASNASLAILPLENMGPATHQYFADGMTEALTTQLAKIEALKVMSRSAVMRYRADRPPPSTIARELGVARLIEGSALLADDRVRITARLIDGLNGQTLWGESYEGDLRDVLTLQARVAREIAREIRVRVTPDEDKRLSSSRSVDPGAYQDYLLGLVAYERALTVNADTPTNLREALSRFQAATSREPSWGEAHGALAQTHLRYAGLSDNHAERVKQYRLAHDIADRALGLDPGGIRARLVLARAGFFINGDWEKAEQQYLEVLRLEPNNADWAYGIFLAYAGRYDESIARLRYALERWPTSPFTGYQIGLTYVFAGRLDDVQREADHLRQRFGDDLHASILEAMILIRKGQYAAAADLLDSRRNALLINRATTYLQHLAYAAAKANQRGRARKALRELESLGGRAGPSIVLALDGADAAVRFVQELHRKKDYMLLQARTWVDYDELRAIPEIARILSDVGISEPPARKS